MIECPLCLDGTLTQHITTHSVQYMNYNGSIDSMYYICNNCGVEQTDFSMTAFNAAQMRKFKESIDE